MRMKVVFDRRPTLLALLHQVLHQHVQTAHAIDTETDTVR
jgi:hypothetical protein